MRGPQTNATRNGRGGADPEVDTMNTDAYQATDEDDIRERVREVTTQDGKQCIRITRATLSELATKVAERVVR